MHLRYLTFFLTLVVLAANAAPDSSIVPSPILTREAPAPSTKGPVEQDSVQTTAVPEVPLNFRKFRMVSDASNSLGIGFVTGVIEKEKVHRSTSTIHLQRTQYNLDESAQEFGFFLSSNDFVSIGVDWGFKRFCCFTNFISAFDPFYKIGAAGIFEPKDRFANLIDYQRYFLQSSFGFENLFYSRKLLRLETGLRYGVPGLHFFTQLSLSFPD